METHKSASVAYIHARPQGHPIHEAYANSLQPDRYFIDFALRWHDVQRPAIVRYLSWFLCALLFPNKRKYDVFYADGPVHFLAIMRFLGLIGKRQKIIYLMADETLYFIQNKYYGKIAARTLRWVIAQADSLICIGDLQDQLAAELFPSVKRMVIYNAVEPAKHESLLKIYPNFESRNIVSICNIGDSDVRCFYKGMDLMLATMDKLLGTYTEYEYMIFGDISRRVQDRLLDKVIHKSRISFCGKFEKVDDVLSDAKLCLHLSRGDAYPTSTLESGLAGIPVVLSKETGTSSMFRQIDHNCIADVESAPQAITYFLKLDKEGYDRYVERSKATFAGCHMSERIELFRKVFDQIIEF